MKAAANLEKHGIDFEDAISIFQGPRLERRSDQKGERRWMAIGEIEGVTIRRDLHAARGAASHHLSAECTSK